MKSSIFAFAVCIICHSVFSQEMEYPNVGGLVEITHLAIEENLLKDYQYNTEALAVVNTSNTFIVIKVQTATNGIGNFVIVLTEFGGSVDLPGHSASFVFKKVDIGFKREVLPNAVGLVEFNARPGENLIVVTTPDGRELFGVFFKNSYKEIKNGG